MKTAVSVNGTAPTISKEEFAERRQTFISKLLPNSVAFVTSNAEHTRSNDTEFPFRQSSDVLYLSDFPEPQSIIVLTNIEGLPRFSMLVRPKDKAREIWTGRRFGPDGAKAEFQADQTYTIDQFPKIASDFLAKAENVYYRFGRNLEFDSLFNTEWVKLSRPLHNPEMVCHEMRMLKSSRELELMRYAAGISARAHRQAMHVCKPGMKEYQIQAELEHIFLTEGARSPAYGSIVAGGNNAVILHYVENSHELKDGELLLIDAACEYRGYASDITRTFPINGKFSKAQKDIYDLVLKSQLKAIEIAKPEVTLLQLHEAASIVLREGLVELGVLTEDVQTAELEKTAIEKAKSEGKEAELLCLKDLFMHGTSHWLGLDVHDVGTIGTRSELAKTLPMKPGMVFTVEPGLYFDPDDARLPEKYRGIGIRIEDDVLITARGHDVLTSDAPKDRSEIERQMRVK
jgi:Xaa-Pro aminopeptidase